MYCKKNMSASDSDVILKRVQTSTIPVQLQSNSQVLYQQLHDVKQDQKHAVDLSVPLSLKSLKNTLSYHPVQPYPFTFISAVKQKLALNDTSEKTHDSRYKTTTEANSEVLKPSSKDNFYQGVSKMDFIKSLKIPDLKISAKTLDYNARENTVSSEINSIKFGTSSDDFIPERPDKLLKERVQRKLDFFVPEGSSINNCESIEPLKAPNLSIVSGLSQKKEYMRETSKEKENRTKRVRKEDFSYLKPEESLYLDFPKRAKSPRHISKKDILDDTSGSMSVGDAISDMPRESDFGLSKAKTRNFATSTVKKDNEKKHRSFNVQPIRLRDNSFDSKNRTNEALTECVINSSEKVISKEASKNAISENMEYKCKEEFHLSKQSEEYRYKPNFENKQVKRQNKTPYSFQGKRGVVDHKEQCKKTSDKTKLSANQIEGKHYVSTFEGYKEDEIVSDTNDNFKGHSTCPVAFSEQLKNKESVKFVKSFPNLQLGKDTTEGSTSAENLLCGRTDTNINKRAELSSQSVNVATEQSNMDDDSRNSDINSLPEDLFDSKRISFRDDNQTQEEFCDLVTPDINLIRARKKKQMTQGHILDIDNGKASKCKTVEAEETTQQGIQLLHPTALHMQFKTELHLLDTFYESLRQVMDVEKCLNNVQHEEEKDLLQKQHQTNNNLISHLATVLDDKKTVLAEDHSRYKMITENASDKAQLLEEQRIIDHFVHEKPSNSLTVNKNVVSLNGEKCSKDEEESAEFANNLRRASRSDVKVAEVQTQTVNDMATQTHLCSIRHNLSNRFSKMCDIMCEQGQSLEEHNIPRLSLGSEDLFENLDQIEDISLPSKIRTMSEISLHETTSSIKTETGTEISISTRDVTYSFNKYLDLEIAQLIKDEKHRFDKVEMLFKSRERMLNDQTKKLVKLEEQKRALRDTGQDSRISSVKKKQRALLLKLQHEKDEMNRLKELHKFASQERKVMLQKQRDMFNPQMSTKNILTKLKRSADSQSPRRLSGPMKGYDIRSNSSVSSFLDSDKSQHDKFQMDPKLQTSESDINVQKLDLPKVGSSIEEHNVPLSRYEEFDEAIHAIQLQEKLQKQDNKSKYELKSQKFEEKMPRSDILKLKSHQFDVESKLMQGHSMNICEHDKSKATSVLPKSQENLNMSPSENIKSESDILMEKKSKSFQSDCHFGKASPSWEKNSIPKATLNVETIHGGKDSVIQDNLLEMEYNGKGIQTLDSNSKISKKADKSITTDKDIVRKLQYTSESKANSKHRSSKCQKTKASSAVLTENILRSKSSSQIEDIKHHRKRTKMEKEFIHSNKNNKHTVLDELDFNVGQNSLESSIRHYDEAVKEKGTILSTDIMNDCESKENISMQNVSQKEIENSSKINKRNIQNYDDISTRSQINTFAISNHTTANIEKNYSESVVIRSHNKNIKSSKKLEQILSAREAALVSRKNCVEEWMAWHARLAEEEDQVAQMEQAVFKLVNTTSALSHQERRIRPFVDTTISSDTSDVEGRVELLKEKVVERRIEMSRLKREARKQAKQKLKALETNLLNQIKRYDATIHEMRKKLETKKDVLKHEDKLAIESESLAKFKVPDIPLKRIQDIYNSNSLLRSRSESDLLKHQQKDVMNLLIYEDQHSRHGSSKLLSIIGNNNSSEFLNLRKEDHDHGIQYNALKDAKETECKATKPGSVLSQPVDIHSKNSIMYKSIFHSNEDQPKQSHLISSQNNDMENQREIKLAKSDKDTITVSEDILNNDQNTVRSELIETMSNNSGYTKQSSLKNIKLQVENSLTSTNKYLKSDSDQQHIEDTNVITQSTDINNGILMYSKKLDSLHLNNKNLNEDINSLENELKVLSEMMSRISGTSNGKQKSGLETEERSTLKDISEAYLKSNSTDISTEISDNCTITRPQLDSTKTPSRFLNSSTSIATLKSYNDLSNERDTTEKITDTIPEEETLFSKTNQEIDYETRSREILNEIEKSIISEHIKMPENDLSTKHEELSRDILSLKSVVKSVSEMITEVMDSQNSYTPIADNVSDVTNNTEKDINTLSVDNQFVEKERKSLDKLSESSYAILKNTPIELSTIIDSALISNTSDIQENLESNTHTMSIKNLQNLSDIECTAKSLDIKSFSNKTAVISMPKKEDSHVLSLQGCNSGTTNTVEDAIITKCDPSIDIQSSDSVNKFNKACRFNDYSLDCSTNFIKHETSKNENKFGITSVEEISLDKDNWTISESFDVQQDEVQRQERLKRYRLKSSSDDSQDTPLHNEHISEIYNIVPQEVVHDVESNIDNVSMVNSKEESININIFGFKNNNGELNSHSMQSHDELDDILDIIARENNKEKNNESIRRDEFENNKNKINDKYQLEINENNEVDKSNIDLKENLQDQSIESVVKNKNQSFVDNIKIDKQQIIEVITSNENNVGITPSYIDNNASYENALNTSLYQRNECNDVPVINVDLQVQLNDEDNIHQTPIQSPDIIITELISEEEESTVSELGVDVKIELAEDKCADVGDKFHKEINTREDFACKVDRENISPIIIQECLESIPEQNSSDGEQLDNLIEVAESGLDTVEKLIQPLTVDFISGLSLTDHQRVDAQKKSTFEIINNSENLNEHYAAVLGASENVVKSFEILKDPEYEDISEESLEVSEIFDKKECQSQQDPQKIKIPEKYETIQKSERMLNILEKIPQKSMDESVDISQMTNQDLHKGFASLAESNVNIQVLQIVNIDKEELSKKEVLQGQISEKMSVEKKQSGEILDNFKITKNKINELPTNHDNLSNNIENKFSPVLCEVKEKIIHKHEQDMLSDSSEGNDTSKGVLEIDTDFNNSRLNVDALDDDLLSGNNIENPSIEFKTEFHAAPIVSSSERDIKTMIDKLKASLEQPGLEVNDLEAKLLRIEQLQIELEIKKLEAEEVSYYVREIPNKPPPPYTPPVGSQLPVSLVSSSPLPATIPSNIEELTAFTEKATALIFKAKQSGENIMNLEAPPEMYELTKESNEVAKKDRKIYNTFLFDLCKEAVSEVYAAEYETPGPSWTKPNVKTKPVMKIPKTVEELKEYVSKEVATLFGFKTKLQRENMVMRWSRKRRDRVDELLAREAQAEEDEWTKFHHDELTVKNGLTVAILDTLIMETSSVVKVAYAKKRKVMI